MKRIATICLTLLLLFALLLPSVSAEGEWNADYYRVGDTSGELDDYDIEELDEMACWIVSSYGIDAVAYSVTDAEMGEFTYDEAAEILYEGFGYGETSDGVLLIYNSGSRKKAMYAFGKAEDYFPESVRNQICEAIAASADEYGIYGVFYDYFYEIAVILQQHVDDGTLIPVSDEVLTDAAIAAQQNKSDSTAQELVAPPDSGTEEAGSEDHSLGVTVFAHDYSGSDSVIPKTSGEDLEADPPEVIAPASQSVKANLPDWYPEDPKSFQFFSDPAAPRVVDLADIFTDEEEEKMLALIEDYTAKTDRDIVIYTDRSSYGFGEAVWSADFYDFNGYGIGPEREGVCLFINMDPADRCWWCCCTGSRTMGAYDQATANKLDDRLEKYMVNGEYGEGVINWIGNMGKFLETGRVPKTAGGWIWTSILTLGSGSIFGGILTGKASSSMITKKKAFNANKYLVNGSLNVRPAGDFLMNVTTTRTKIESSSGSGKSSYSGSYRGSSGASHSGSGRHF